MVAGSEPDRIRIISLDGVAMPRLRITWAFAIFVVGDGSGKLKLEIEMPSEQISLSGMRAAERKLEASAHKTANVSTDGFERKRVQSREHAGVETRTGPVELTDDVKLLVEQADGPHNNVDQVSETVERISSSAQFTANARKMRLHDRLLKSLLDIFA